MATTILRLAEVIARTKLSRSTIYNRIAQGNFPAPIPLGGRTIGFIEAEVEHWLKQLIEDHRGTPSSPTTGGYGDA